MLLIGSCGDLAIPERVHGKVAALNSFEEIAKLIAQAATASSLAAMDL